MKPNIKFFTYVILSFAIVNFAALIRTALADGEVVFRDDFMGKSLRPEWKISVNDPNRMGLIDNEYLLLVTYGPSAKNRMVYKEEMPENYEITLKIQTTSELSHQASFLGVRGDSKNSLWVYYLIDAGGYQKVIFGKNLVGEWSEYSRNINFSRGKSLYLRLAKKGIEYTGYHSLDGATWSKIGTHVFLNLKGKPEFLVRNEKKGVAESGIRIDYFEIKKIE